MRKSDQYAAKKAAEVEKDSKDVQDQLHQEEIAAQLGEDDTAWDKVKRLCRETKLAAISALVILLIVLAAVFAPLVAPYDPTKQDLTHRLEGMSLQHIFGTDQLGRDVLSRMIYGARISLCIGIFPTMISMILGTILGLMSGYLGKTVDFIIMRLADIVMAFVYAGQRYCQYLLGFDDRFVGWHRTCCSLANPVAPGNGVCTGG